MSCSEDDDYMSDKFSCDKVPDVRPGLAFSHKRKREMEMEAQKKARIAEHKKKKPGGSGLKKLQQESLEKGMSSAIPKSSIGFSMLAKMGFKEGDSLGKTGQGGITEPIGITVKDDRKGLGTLTKIREKQQERLRAMRAKRSKADSCDPHEFRLRMMRKQQQKQMEKDFQKCQRVCRRLDMDIEFEEPTIKWFWPEMPKEAKDDEAEEKEEAEENNTEEGEDCEDEAQYEPHEKLELITDYLRTTHCYCLWCEVKYDCVEDMDGNCPGISRDEH